MMIEERKEEEGLMSHSRTDQFLIGNGSKDIKGKVIRMGMEEMETEQMAKCTPQTMVYDQITRIYRANGYSWLGAQREADRIIEEKRERDLGGEQ